MGSAMTTIRTTCPTCGEVDMGAAAISLRVSGASESAAYEFTCPECRTEVSKRANRKTVAAACETCRQRKVKVSLMANTSSYASEMALAWALRALKRPCTAASSCNSAKPRLMNSIGRILRGGTAIQTRAEAVWPSSLWASLV